jgi:hypothetical protein
MTPEERDNLPMRQQIQFDVTAKQLREMDIAADACGLNLTQFMLQAALAAAEPPRQDAVVIECEWPGCAAQFTGEWAHIEVVNHTSRAHIRGGSD